MARAKVNGKKGLKEENICYINNCHHGDNTQNQESKRKSRDKKRINER